MGLRLRKIRSRVEDLVFKDVQARLAHLLLELKRTDGVPDGAGTRLRVKLTHQKMANLIGCSRETVNATLGQFRERRLIRIDGHSNTILDSYGLHRLVT